jgi:hypothetical protein
MLTNYTTFFYPEKKQISVIKKLILFFILSLLFTPFTVYSQQEKNSSSKKVGNFIFAKKINTKKATFFDFTKKEKTKTEASSVGERVQFEYDMLKDPATGKVPRMAWKKALDAAAATDKYENDPSRPLGILSVTPKGPSNLGGRTRALGIDVRDNNVMIAGSVSSGVFRTTNGGTSWTRVVPAGAIHNIVSIAQDPRPGFQDTWYFGTGESTGNSADLGPGNSGLYAGFGIWKSSDNGLNWTQLAGTASNLELFSSPFDYVHKIVVDPTNGNVYAAACDVISRSTDGGTTWATVLGTLNNNGYSDVIVTPTGRLYAAFNGSDGIEGVHTSTTGGSGSWTKIAGTIAAVVTPATWNAATQYGRVVLNYAPSNPDIVYALYWNNITFACPSVTPEAELFRWDQSTSTWTDLSANLPVEANCSVGNSPFAVQFGYDLVVAVKPDDANTVFIGGTNIYRSTNGFTSTAATTRIGGYNSSANYAQYPNSHPDIHALIFGSGSNNILYSGNDGGIQKADITAGSVTWTPLNNDYVTYQYYHADILPVGGSDILIGGAQDNGTTINTGGTTGSFVFGGDGVAVGFVSYTDPSNFSAFVGSQRGNLWRLTAPSFGFSIRPTGATGIFITYFNLDQDNTNHLFHTNFNTLYRTRIAKTITGGSITGDANSGWETMTGAAILGDIRSMATSRNNTYANAAYTGSDVNRKLYIGTATGRVYRMNDPAFVPAATPAVDISPVGFPAAIVSSISVNPSDDNEILVTYSNYGVNSVYHTTNANSATPTWTVVEGPAGSAVQLASARSSAIAKVLGVTEYFVGTSTGLYTTTTLSGATTNWTRVGSSEINFAVVSQLRYRPADNKILAATHGNGFFLITLSDPFALDIKLQSFNAVKQGDEAIINWRVGYTSTAKSFEVLKSVDGRNFSTLKSLNATSNTADYNTTDNNLGVGATYYKLKMTDQNGSISYSNVAVVYNKHNGFEITSMIPTLVNSTANINIATNVKKQASLIVIDAQGKTIYNQSVFLQSGNNNYNLNLSNLAKGTYYIYAVAKDGKSNVTDFVKQ